ncbi:hypothetical protein ACFWP2_16820 [Kitasatospora sp. NPDC058444]|uniref:hypothetical protein n=1 Tax=Kitasatospora sp. NPDC058444 TaxID=3346504 RepID=UPI0036607AD5
MKFTGRAGLAFGGVLVLAACSGGGGGGTAAPSASATALPSASATPFGTTLAQSLEPVGAGLAKVAAATTMKDVETALAMTESSADRAVRSLTAAAAPGGADTARTELVAGLNTLSSEALTIRTDLNLKKYCTAGVVQARLGGGQGVVAVPAAIAKLAAAGQQVAFAVPQLPKPQPQPRALENGTLVRDGGNHGKGELVFDNNGATDVVVSVVQDGQSVASVYVVKGQKAGIDGIKTGSYSFHYTTGVDWDSEAKQFTQDCRFAKVGDVFEFEPSGTTWTFKARAEDGKRGASTWLTAGTAPQP